MTNANGNGQPKVIGQVVVTLFDNGQVQVQTSAPTKHFIYGLLEMGKEAVLLQSLEHQQASKIVPARGMLPGQ